MRNVGSRDAGMYVGTATPTPLSGTPGLGGIGLSGGAPSSHGTPRPSASGSGLIANHIPPLTGSVK